MTKFQWHHAGRSTMDEKESRQPPAVPFLREEKPGTTMNWKPPVVPTHPTPPSPANLTPSVPFLWEEMPGKPLPSCLERPLSTESTFLLPLKSDGYDTDGYDNDDNGYEPDDMFDLDLVSTTGASKAAQVQITFTAEDSGGQSEGHSSSASRSGSSTSFSDWLSSDFFHKVGSQKGTSSVPQKQQNEDDGGGGSGSVIAKRVIPTLGELIRMSGRRSFNRLAAENQTRTKDCSKECTNRRAFKCWIFGIRGRRES